MRWILMLLLFVSLFVSVRGQEVVTQTMAGPVGEKYRILLAFMSMEDQGSYKLQSFILDTNRVKKNEQPSAFYLDLTSTIRNTATGEKKQKILVQRWITPADVEVKCDGGKWIKQSSSPELDLITDTVKSVIQIVPLDAKDAKEFELPPDLSKKIT